MFGDGAIARMTPVVGLLGSRADGDVLVDGELVVPAVLGRIDASVPCGSATVSTGRWAAGMPEAERAGNGNQWSPSVKTRHSRF